MKQLRGCPSAVTASLPLFELSGTAQPQPLAEFDRSQDVGTPQESQKHQVEVVHEIPPGPELPRTARADCQTRLRSENSPRRHGTSAARAPR